MVLSVFVYDGGPPLPLITLSFFLFFFLGAPESRPRLSLSHTYKSPARLSRAHVCGALSDGGRACGAGTSVARAFSKTKAAPETQPHVYHS